jgi:multiple sugar transport system ATP-binding protein
MSSISLRQVEKRHGPIKVLHNIDLEIEAGSFVVLVGPSGCGKSTTLRLIAGLDTPSGGEIAMGGQVVNDLGPAERDIAMVFQNYALYPHMTVRRNLAFGLENLKLPKAEIDQRVDEAVRVLELTALMDRKPAQLSGGQRQRVAMGRALVRHPQVFLFDEPLSNLDAQLRASMRIEIKKLHRRTERTLVYVTHDQIEAMTLADVIVVMRAGRIEQVGTPSELFARPANMFVGSFIGSPAMNMLPVTRDGAAFSMGHGSLALPAAVTPPSAAQLSRAVLGIRPDDIRLTSDAPPEWLRFSAVAKVVEPMGTECVVNLDAAGTPLTARLRGRDVPREGEMLSLAVNPAPLCWFDPATELALQH